MCTAADDKVWLQNHALTRNYVAPRVLIRLRVHDRSHGCTGTPAAITGNSGEPGMFRPSAEQVADLIRQKREEFGYRDLAQELLCSAAEARRFVDADRTATGCDAIYQQVLKRGTEILAEKLGTTPEELDAYVAQHP